MTITEAPTMDPRCSECGVVLRNPHPEIHTIEGTPWNIIRGGKGICPEHGEVNASYTEPQQTWDYWFERLTYHLEDAFQ